MKVLSPHICGDSVDINPTGETILTGSWRVDNQLQLWDFHSGKLKETIDWDSLASNANLIYASQFSKGGKYIAACGSGLNEAKVFNRSTLKVIKIYLIFFVILINCEFLRKNLINN